MARQTGLKAAVFAIPAAEWPLSVAQVHERLAAQGVPVERGFLSDHLARWSTWTDAFSPIYRRSWGVYDHRSHRQEAR